VTDRPIRRHVSRLDTVWTCNTASQQYITQANLTTSSAKCEDGCSSRWLQYALSLNLSLYDSKSYLYTTSYQNIEKSTVCGMKKITMDLSTDWGLMALSAKKTIVKMLIETAKKYYVLENAII